MQPYQDYFEANKELWNRRTAVHKDSSFYDGHPFSRAGLHCLQLKPESWVM